MNTQKNSSEFVRKNNAQEKDPTLVMELCAHVFNTESGKRLLEELKKKFVEGPIWVPGNPQDSFVYFREGQRHLVMWLQEASKFKS